VGFLFDTDAISELFKPKPNPAYVAWLAGVPREEQCTSAVVVGELFAGAMRRGVAARHVKNLRERVLPLVRVVPFDAATAEAYGRLRASLEDAGLPVADLDMQIGATAIVHGLELVTGNTRHYERMDGLVLNRVLAEARKGSRS
jgi:predicted nucleic acid-binding protein